MGNVSHYKILKPLGSGGMGQVVLAEDTRLDRQVALKLLPPEVGSESTLRQRFLSEAKAASALNHPNICTIHEVGETEDARLFIAMEFVEGKPLDSLLMEGALSVPAALRYAVQLAEALEAAHESNIVHRDIKPSNICINARGLLKVLDFGLAKRLRNPMAAGGEEEPTLTATAAGQVLGTPAYMSPEQALGRTVDHRSDLFSFGVVLYQMLTRRSPFAGASLGDTIHRIIEMEPEPLRRWIPDLPLELVDIVSRCLQKEPDRRYSSAHDLGADLRSLARSLDSGSNRLDAPTAVRGGESVAGSQRFAAAEPELSASMSALSESDVFVTYAKVDNEPLLGARNGWVSQFCRNLELRLEQLSGDRVRLWSHPNPSGQGGVDDQILRRLPDMKALISVVSPPFAKSESCWREVEQFWRSAQQSGTLNVDHKTRLFKAVKTPVSARDLPPSLSGVLGPLLGFDFFEIDAETGRLREFSEEFGEDARRHFLERVYDLAYEVNQVLGNLRKHQEAGQAQTPRRLGKAVYLAETTSDLRGERDQVRRELQERGFEVLPDVPLPMVADELEEVVRRHLGRAEAVIHLIGHRYGMVPEGASDSVGQVQARLSAEAAQRSGLVRFIWQPPALVTDDTRQLEFLRELREGKAGMDRTELLSGPLETLKNLVIKQLTSPPPEPKAAVVTSTQVQRVYLVCDARDEQAVEPIEDYLYGHDLEVKVPVFEGDPDAFVRMHQEHLTLCDAVLIYYGQASAQWVEIKLMDLLKAPGYGRQKPWAARAVYIAPPEHRRKERFRSHDVEVVRESSGFNPELLKGFVSGLKAASGEDPGL